MPSEHGAVLFVWTQPPVASHVSVVHTLPSSQAMVANRQPRVGSQVSAVQAFPSLQVRKVPRVKSNRVAVRLCEERVSKITLLKQPKARPMRVRSRPPSKNSDVLRMLSPSLS